VCVPFYFRVIYEYFLFTLNSETTNLDSGVVTAGTNKVQANALLAWMCRGTPAPVVPCVCRVLQMEASREQAGAKSVFFEGFPCGGTLLFARDFQIRLENPRKKLISLQLVPVMPPGLDL
jgi:hypothetical protein